ncbi:MAG TPA: hypothetical protein VFD82_17725 [Planctomycetota bacterium]|nr:hypothetical protein [Planctomycetota bacterium]
MAGNVATFGLGMVVDMALGADVNLVDDPVLVVLASNHDPPLAPWVRVGETSWSPPEPECGNEGLRGLGYLLAGVLQAVDYNNRRH